MAHLLDLKNKAVVEDAEIPEPTAQLATAWNPAVSSQEIITDTGTRYPFQTVNWTGPIGYRVEGTGIPYFLGFILVVAGVSIGIFFNEYISSLLFILLGIMLFMHARTPYPHVEIEISPVGIKLGNRRYSHSDVESFWIHHDLGHGIPELSFHLKRWHMPYIKIPLYDQDPSQVRLLLLEFIPEVEHDDPQMHRLLKHLGI